MISLANRGVYDFIIKERERARKEGRDTQHNIAGGGTTVTLQSSVKTFLPGFGNGWLKYCVAVHFWVGLRDILRVILET